MKRVYRTWSQLTAVDVQRICDQTSPDKYTKGGLGDGEFMPEYSSDLDGKHIVLNFNNTTWNYHFIESRTLTFDYSDGKEINARCNVHQAPGVKDVYFIQHYCSDSTPPTARTIIIDFNTGRATMVVATLNHPKNPAQVQREFMFGTIEGVTASGDPHSFTNDLVGTAINWRYHRQAPVIKHIYSSPYYYTYTGNFGGTWMASNPADYVKINDHLYIFSMVEERQTGVQGLFLINMKTLHDVGSFFGCHAVGMECYTVGAKGELTTMHTTAEEYEAMISK
jgi:phenolic acid decarboxylase